MKRETYLAREAGRAGKARLCDEVVESSPVCCTWRVIHVPVKCAPRRIFILFLLMVLSPFPSHAESLRKPRSTCEFAYPSDAAIEWNCRTLRAKESLETVFGEQWVDVARFNRIDRRHVGAGSAIKMPKRLEDLEGFQPIPAFYPPAEHHEQFILIDLSEQFLGAYEYGALRFALPIASGSSQETTRTPTGVFRLSAAHRRHQSTLFTVEGTETPYPMNYALRFHINREGVSYWIHGRDMPGYPASHGCIGLYDEAMQKEQYGIPQYPELHDAKRLFEWVVGGNVEDDRVIFLPNGPRIHIVGQAPR